GRGSDGLGLGGGHAGQGELAGVSVGGGRRDGSGRRRGGQQGLGLGRQRGTGGSGRGGRGVRRGRRGRRRGSRGGGRRRRRRRDQGRRRGGRGRDGGQRHGVGEGVALDARGVELLAQLDQLGLAHVHALLGLAHELLEALLGALGVGAVVEQALHVDVADAAALPAVLLERELDGARGRGQQQDGDQGGDFHQKRGPRPKLI